MCDESGRERRQEHRAFPADRVEDTVVTNDYRIIEDPPRANPLPIRVSTSRRNLNVTKPFSIAANCSSPDVCERTGEEVSEARTKTEKALAFGFVSHNEKWGIDLTAHKSGITYGTSNGYIIAKADQLLSLAPLDPALGIPGEAARTIYHTIVETGVDILVKEHLDPHVGQKVAISALMRSPEFPFLLVRAYGDEIAEATGLSHRETARFVVAAERELRKGIALYGQALTQDTATAVTLLSEQMVDLAEAFLGQPLPVDREVAVVLVSDLVYASMWLCADDFAGEITATIAFVSDQLSQRGVTY